MSLSSGSFFVYPFVTNGRHEAKSFALTSDSSQFASSYYRVLCGFPIPSATQIFIKENVAAVVSGHNISYAQPEGKQMK